MEAEEHKAPRVGSCWDLGPAIKRHGYIHFLTLHRYTSHLSCSDPSRYHSHDYACAFRHICSLDLLREKPGKHMTAEAPLAVAHPMFSHQVEERKWADDKRPVIFMLLWWTDSIEVTCQQLRLRTFSLNMENSSTGGKKPDSSCHFCRLCQYTHDGFFSRQDIRYLHICWIPCRRLHAARHCAYCHAASKAVCNVTVLDKPTFVI